MEQFGLEALSRGAKKAILCDSSKAAMEIIERNIKKTHMQERVKTYNCEFTRCLENVESEPIDLVYLDPPYATKYIEKALEKIQELNIGNEDLKIVIETDEEERILKEIEDLNFEIIDKRKYGRVIVIFLSRNSFNFRKG